MDHVQQERMIPHMVDLLRRFPAVMDRHGIFQAVRWHCTLVEGGIGKVRNGLGGCTECGGEETHPIMVESGTATSCGSPAYRGMRTLSLRESEGSKNIL